MRETIGIGIVGTGFAERVQMPALRHVEGARLVAVSSGRRANAERAAKAFDIPHVCDDFEELAALPDVDLVIISSPPHTHEPASLAAARHGKAILCEKPTALDLAEATRMREAAESANVLNLIDHELRFSPIRQRMRDLIRDGYVGDVSHVCAVYRNGFGLTRNFNWWYTSAAGGGVLGAIGSHLVDAVRFFVGEIEEVDCRLRTFVAERRDDATGEMRRSEVDDFASLRLGLVGNATAEISLSSVAPEPAEHMIDIVGPKGRLRLDDEAGTLTGTRGRASEDLTVADPARDLDGVLPNAWSPAFVHYARAIVAALRAGETTIPDAATFADGERVQAVLDAARRSDASGRREILV